MMGNPQPLTFSAVTFSVLSLLLIPTHPAHAQSGTALHNFTAVPAATARLTSDGGPAVAQGGIHFQHIILVIQENRTPDNLFGASGLPGLDVQLNLAKGKAVDMGDPHGPGLPHNRTAFLRQAAGKFPIRAYNYVATGADPYWDIAAKYGFANYMFQTNQGTSFPAHQFLVSGTSAPSDTSDLFVSFNGTSNFYGCEAPAGTVVPTIAPDGTEGTVYPCFDRSSLIDLLVNAGLTWRYYAVSKMQIWDAPIALENYYQSPNVVLNPPQVLTDIANGTLANVSWVTPANAYSDHPTESKGGGPAWVASIVDAVGDSPYWVDTVILVTWDDWGGWYDHVPPPANSTGWCEIYCYGFRVPLLVISPLTPAGYVDNGIHDFGSILRFVENNFSLGLIGPGTWADSYADDLRSFFQVSAPARPFRPIKSRKLTPAELSDKGDPDDY